MKDILQKYGHSLSKKKIKIIDIEQQLGPNEQLTLPLITGLIVKRYSVRASKKMHSKMNRLYKKFISVGEPIDADSYIKKWEIFVSLVGMFNTIEYVEPSSTKKSRTHIMKVIKQNKNNYAFHVSIKRVKLLKFEQKIYDAYKNNTLFSFIQKNRDILIDYNKN